MATLNIRHSIVSGGAPNPAVDVDGPAWDAAHTVTGIDQVDNTSDINKPVSTAQAAADAAVTAAFQAADALKAPLASPGFSGTPTAPTPSPGDNDSSIATTAFVTAAVAVVDAAKASLASPTFTGNPTAPTPSPGDNDTSIATTAFVTAADAVLTTAINLKANIASPTFTGNPAAPTPSPGDNDTSIATTAFVQAALTGSIVRFDTAQGLTAAQKSQARSNIDVQGKNYIINGAMMISQQNGTTGGTATGYYPVDQFMMGFVHGGTSTAAQVASATPGGSTHRLRVTATVADASVAASDFLGIVQNIEGVRASDLMLGTASAKTITVSFGVKAPAGTYYVCLRNAANNRNYLAPYVITGGEANTDVRKSVTIALDQSGTWLKDSSIGLSVMWSLMTGATFHGNASTWQAGNLFAFSDQFNFMGTISNVFELFDVALKVESVASAYETEDHATDLRACMRFWQILRWSYEGDASAPQQRQSFTCALPATMRVAPSRTRLTTGTHANVRASDPTTYVAANAIDNQSVFIQVESAAAGTMNALNFVESYNARM